MKKEEFDEYIRQVEPSAQQSAADWQTAIGLQQVDGLKLYADQCSRRMGDDTLR